VSLISNERDIAPALEPDWPAIVALG
jgi:hypothetical protein